MAQQAHQTRPAKAHTERVRAIQETITAFFRCGAEFEEDRLRDLAEALGVPYVAVRLAYEASFDEPGLTARDLRDWCAAGAPSPATVG